MRIAIGLLILTGGIAAHAGVSQPLTITQSGTYTLPQDLAVDAAPAIIVAAPDVTIDLYGYSVSVQTTDQPAVLMAPGSGMLRIANGNISGGSSCLGGDVIGTRTQIDNIHCASAVSGVALRSSGLFVANSEFRTQKEAFKITGSYPLRFIGNTIVTTDPANGGVSFHGVWTGRIVNNSIDSAAATAALEVTSDRAVRVDHNDVHAPAATAGISVSGGPFTVGHNIVHGGVERGIAIDSPAGMVVDNFVVFGGGHGTGIAVAGDGVTVSSNTVSERERGLDVAGMHDLVIANTVRASSDAGILVTGASNRLAANHIASAEPNARGLVFAPPSAGNFYKINQFEGNPGGDVVDDGTGNVDGGGNVYDLLERSGEE